ncbi:hypothetical protein V0288_23715 [Pannus brasiliensis CCIBt3594]|uniref:Secreted protein n=1 Tax=Pannus brasiliensis CCIBt3594 TaxID=1427578 RepID=A0AAW9QSV6_9CHRO
MVKYHYSVLVLPVVPSSVASLVAAASSVGFSGSRSPVAASLAAVRSVAALVPASCPVSVGCAAGVDAAARSLFPSARVFQAASFGVGRGSFAARSVACVRSLPPGGLWLSFPASPCPPGLSPSSSSSRCFAGFGAGSWSSLALALGLGLSCVVFLPPGVPSPGWGLVSVGGGWWVSSPPPVSPVQLSLFSVL